MERLIARIACIFTELEMEDFERTPMDSSDKALIYMGFGLLVLAVLCGLPLL